MSAIKSLWRTWVEGFYHQVEYQSDSEILVAYEEAKRGEGSGSQTAESLEARVRAIEARRRGQSERQT